MRMKGWGAVSAALLVSCALVTPAQAAQRKIEPLNQYVVRGGDVSKLGELGYDTTEGGSAKGQAIVATPKQAAGLRAKGFTVTAPYGELKTAQAAPPDPFSDPTH